MFNIFKKKVMTTENEVKPEGEVTPTVGVARLYEIVDKVTGEVFPVDHDGSGDLDNDQDADFFCKKADGTEVVFVREGSNDDGAIFVNAQFVIRDRETKTALNGITLVPDVVPAPAPSNEGSAPEGDAPADASEFHVYDKAGTFVRSYNTADHGEGAKEIATQFAAKIGGTVK